MVNISFGQIEIKVTEAKINSTFNKLSSQAVNSKWLHYDGDPFYRIDEASGLPFTVASRFTPTELVDYYNTWNISEVFIAIGNIPNNIILKIWEGPVANNLGQLIYEDNITDIITHENHWYGIALIEEIPLKEGKEYWVGYSVTHSEGQYPAYADAGPMINNKGGWIGWGANPLEWYQITQINGGEYDFNWNIRVRIVSQIPAQTPTLSSPSNGATGVSTNPTLSWNASGGATNYTLQISKNSNMSSPVVNQSGITGTAYHASGLGNGTQYYWRVIATNAGGSSD